MHSLHQSINESNVEYTEISETPKEGSKEPKSDNLRTKVNNIVPKINVDLKQTNGKCHIYLIHV